MTSIICSSVVMRSGFMATRDPRAISTFGRHMLARWSSEVSGRCLKCDTCSNRHNIILGSITACLPLALINCSLALTLGGKRGYSHFVDFCVVLRYSLQHFVQTGIKFRALGIKNRQSGMRFRRSGTVILNLGIGF